MLTKIKSTSKSKSKSKSKISLELFLSQNKFDSFGRSNQVEANDPTDIKSDRVGNTPGAVNNAILTKGWLRVKIKDFKSEQPKQKDELSEFPKDPQILNDFPTSQEPLDMNEKQKSLMCDSDGFLMNPLFKQDSFKEVSTSPVPCLNCFQFRLSGLSLQFTQLKEDMTVITSLNIKNITNIDENVNDAPSCITIKNMYGGHWQLCAASAAEKQEWYCSIKYAMGTPCEGKAEPPKPGSPMTKLTGKQNIIEPQWILPMPSPWCNVDWNYNNLGTDWQCRCWDGQNQSPIDLPAVDQLPELTTGATIEFWKVDGEMIVEKNQIALQPKDKDKGFGLMTSQIGDVQRATHVIFHHESDHTIHGKHSMIEAQIFYKLDDTSKAGKRAMISVLQHEEVDAHNPLFEQFAWDLLNGHGKYEGNDNQLDLNFLFLDPEPSKCPGSAPTPVIKFDQWLQGGSTPHPPCDENTWVIVKHGTNALAKYQGDLFKKARNLWQAGEKMFRNTNNWRGTFRTTQPLKHRKVFFVKNGDCMKADDEAKLNTGHFEVIKNIQNDYVFVDKKDPSGLPGAYVIRDNEVGM